MKKTGISVYFGPGNVYRSLLFTCVIIFFPGVSQTHTLVEGSDISMSPMSEADNGDEHNLFSGKPAIPFAITYEVEESPVVGKPFHIAIKVSSDVDTDSLQLQVSPESGLSLLDTSEIHRFGSLRKFERRGFDMHLMPQRDGVFRLRLAFSFKQNGVDQSGVFTIPVAIGSHAALQVPKLPAGARKGADEEGRPLLIFSVQTR